MKPMIKRVALATLVTLTIILSGAGAYAWISDDVTILGGNSGTVSGMYIGSKHWSGTITITGDTVILGNLRVDPGTIVKFVLGDDQGWGDEVAPDGFNDDDPTRLTPYSKTHSDVVVLGRLTAVGTKENPITFTSGSSTPTYADWQGLIFRGNGSILDYTEVYYSRNGITPIGSQPDSVVRNSKIVHVFWGCISAGSSSITIEDNETSDCGHEGIDVQGGSHIIRRNKVSQSQAGIVILAGSPTVEQNTVHNSGDGIHVEPVAHPALSNNTITYDQATLPKEWRWQNFSYKNKMLEVPNP